MQCFSSKQVRYALIDWFILVWTSSGIYSYDHNCTEMIIDINTSEKIQSILIKANGCNGEESYLRRMIREHRWGVQAYWVHLYCAELVLCCFISLMPLCGRKQKSLLYCHS